MKLLLALSIISFSTFVESMQRTQSGELTQRAHQTVTPKSRFGRSISAAKLVKVVKTVKRSTSSSSLYNLSKAVTKPAETKPKEELQSSTPIKAKKFQFETVFIDKELMKLTTNFDQEAETALMDGDSKKFQEAYNRMDSLRAQQAILAKAEQYRGFDPAFCHVIVLLSNQKETDQK